MSPCCLSPKNQIAGSGWKRMTQPTLTLTSPQLPAITTLVFMA